MSDYGKKTVAELTEILKTRGLPHSGKKAELVARLNEDDTTKKDIEVDGTAEAAAEIAEPIPQQEPTLAKPLDPVDAPAVPAPPAPSTDPDTTTNAVPESTTADTTAPSIGQPSFSAHLANTELDAELEKRKARAARFGASAETTTTDDSAEAAAKRAARFGIPAEDTTVVKGLDSALPERRERKPGGGRGGAGRDSRGGRDNNRQNGGGGRNRRGNTPRVNEKGGVQKQQSNPFPSEKDKAAAEARLKRFAAA